MAAAPRTCVRSGTDRASESTDLGAEFPLAWEKMLGDPHGPAPPTTGSRGSTDVSLIGARRQFAWLGFGHALETVFRKMTEKSLLETTLEVGSGLSGSRRRSWHQKFSFPQTHTSSGSEGALKSPSFNQVSSARLTPVWILSRPGHLGVHGHSTSRGE